MRILFISASPIKKEISIGNTFLNLFSGMDDVEFASICTRTGSLDPSISRCFCVTDKMLVRSILGKGPAGAEQKCGGVSSGVGSNAAESDAVRFAKKKRWSIFFLAQNLLWMVGRWKSRQLREFVEDYQPDILFTVFSNKIYLNRLILHTKSLSKKKLIVYAWDNNYSLKRLSISPFGWIGHFCNRYYMRKVAKKVDKMYVISDLQKKDYEKAFHKSCTVITKAEDFSEAPPLKTVNAVPLQLVYAGNLYANRWKSLKMLADALVRINRDGVRAQLRIYTATPLTEVMEKALDIEGTSFLMGAVPASELSRIQSEADILVHAEAMDLKNRLTVRQSFSTKLVDYFKAARPIVAVGPKNVASIKHLIDHDAAIVADNDCELYEKLEMLMGDTQQMHDYATRAYLCGRNHHDKKRQQALLRRDLLGLLEN